jgi:dimeric dUTPase (all-alpha-NTP-PPase superfamily)
MKDRFLEMWEQQHQFMELLHEKRGFPKFPVDLNSKGGQKLLKEITHECQHELFEANQHLKNSKAHRVTDVNEFDREAYLEELVDSLHYYIEIAIASGVTPDELFNAYMKKGYINVNRIENGY